MFRFTIRELVLLTLVVAMSLAWWLNAKHVSRVEAEHKMWQERAHFLRAQLTGPDSEIYAIEFTDDRMLVTLKNRTKSP